MRKLPIYFLVDTAESMRGEPIESVKNGLRMLVAALRKDPQVLESACISIVTCGGCAEQLLPMTAIESVQMPDIVAQGCHCIGAGLELLCDCRIREVVSATSERRGDWLPLVFFLTDGTSDDDISRGLKRFHALSWGSVVSCALGPYADRSIMSRVSGEDRMLELASADQSTLSAFFVWKSQVPCSSEIGIGHYGEDDESWCKRVWDGRYFQCDGCHEIYAYTLKNCPYCGGGCHETKRVGRVKSRKWPIYILVDTSESMRGEPMEASINGVRKLISALRNDPGSLEVANLSVITFGGGVREVVPLTGLSEVADSVADFAVEGDCLLVEALGFLQKRVNAEVEKGYKGDFPVNVYIFSEVNPSDFPLHIIKEFENSHFIDGWRGCISLCSLRENSLDKSELQWTPDYAINLSNVTESSFNSSLNWYWPEATPQELIDQDGSNCESFGDLPPPPQEVILI